MKILQHLIHNFPFKFLIKKKIVIITLQSNQILFIQEFYSFKYLEIFYSISLDC